MLVEVVKSMTFAILDRNIIHSYLERVCYQILMIFQAVYF